MMMGEEERKGVLVCSLPPAQIVMACDLDMCFLLSENRSLLPIPPYCPFPSSLPVTTD
jgi:hypothetical protein